MRQFIGVLLLIGGADRAFFAMGSVLWQQRAIHDFVPVDTQILYTEIRRHPGKNTTYSPEIAYRYMVNGRQYESTRVLPVTENGTANWAAGIVARFERRGPGVAATAYIDPDNPAESILVREYSGTPYAFSMAALLAAEIGAGLLTGIISGTRQKMIALPLDDSGWQLVLPAKSLRKNLLDSAAWFVGGTLGIALPLLHWLFVARQQNAKSLVLAGILAIGPLVLFLLMLRRWSVSRHLSDARVRVRPTAR